MRSLIAVVLALASLGCPADPHDSEGCECDTDTDIDSDTDVDSDTDTDAWDHCPEPDSYEGDPGWAGVAEASAGAVYCGSFDEGRTLEQELAAKAQLRVVQGSYPLPTVDGGHQLTLPVCIRRAPDVGRQGMSGGGRTTVSTATTGGITYLALQGSQPMSDGTPWTLEHTLRLAGAEGADPEPLVLDGGAFDLESGAGAEFWLAPEGGGSSDPEVALFSSCFDGEAWHREQHSVVFDGGELTLDLWIGVSVEGTEPAGFTAAAGTLDGTSFAIEDYFQLVYRPEHHHYRRHFAVVFDRPIGEACALRIEEVDPWSDTPTATVATADCELGVLEQRAVSAQSTTRDD